MRQAPAAFICMAPYMSFTDFSSVISSFLLTYERLSGLLCSLSFPGIHLRQAKRNNRYEVLRGLLIQAWKIKNDAAC